MTFEEAFQSARQLLDQRGQLMNVHLLRVVERDEELFREVREALIRDGIAEDRSGVGLVKIEVVVAATADGRSRYSFKVGSDQFDAGMEIPESANQVAEWWVMSRGQTNGPFTLAALCQKRRSGELGLGDVVRQGETGNWLQPSTVPLLSSFAPPQTIDVRLLGLRNKLKDSRNQFSAKPTSPSESSPEEEPRSEIPLKEKTQSSENYLQTEPVSPEQQASETGEGREIYVPPEKIWSLGHRTRRGWIRRGWNLVADLVGGEKRLRIGLVATALSIAFVYWWMQPPAPGEILSEFKSCYSAIQKLRDKRAPRSEYDPVVARYLPRVRFMVERLRFSRGQAQRELFLAGSDGLIPLLGHPKDPYEAEIKFEQHFETARQLLEKK
jgi:hypothetical protein